MIDPVPLATQLGAEVRGVDLTRLGAGEFDAIYAAWLHHGVLRVRGQKLADEDLEEFSARFGPLGKMPLGRLPERMSEAEILERLGLSTLYVTAISNIVKDGRPQGGLGNAEAQWHSDMSYNETPPTASVLYAVAVPVQGGDTHFACQYAAYDALPPALRERVSSLTLVHDSAHDSVGGLRPGFTEIETPDHSPGAVHPIVREHPETGRPALFLGRRPWAYVPGLPLPESEALLDEIWSYVALPEHCFTQRWEVGDVVIWDNRRTLHRRAAFPADARRMMRRCQVLAPQA